MHVRMTLIDGVDDVDAAVGVLRNDIVPAVQELQGFRGIAASADRQAGLLAILSFWDTTADEAASADQIGQVRENAIMAIGGSLIEVQAYEQMLEEVSTPPEPGCPVLLTPTRMDPAKVDENLQFFRTKVLPDIQSTPGFRAVRYFINRQTGEGLVANILSDEESVKAAEAKADKRRAAAAQQGVELGPRSRREIIFTRPGLPR